jgi:gluconolactonase
VNSETAKDTPQEEETGVDWQFDLVAETGDDTLDGPVWDGSGLLFCKVKSSQIMRYDGESGDITVVRRYTVQTRGLAFGPRGELYGAQSNSRRIVRYKDDGSAWYLNAVLDGKRHNHPQDLAVDGTGRIWFTDPVGEPTVGGPNEYPPLDHSSVLRLEKVSGAWTVKRMTYDTSRPQGIALSRDERTLYVTEGKQEAGSLRFLKAYPINEDGALGAPVVMHTFSSDHRGPQAGGAGMCTDSEGNVVLAAGSSVTGPGPLVYVVAPSGRVLETHALPDGGTPTNCAFGGPDLGTLFVTTREGNLFQAKATGLKG